MKERLAALQQETEALKAEVPRLKAAADQEHAGSARRGQQMAQLRKAATKIQKAVRRWFLRRYFEQQKPQREAKNGGGDDVAAKKELLQDKLSDLRRSVYDMWYAGAEADRKDKALEELRILRYLREGVPPKPEAGLRPAALANAPSPAQAATRIQASWRGVLERRIVSVLFTGLMVYGEVWVLDYRDDLMARRIQGSWAARLRRLERKRRTRAGAFLARRICAMVVARRARRQVQVMKRDNEVARAVQFIQRVWRGYRCRLDVIRFAHRRRGTQVARRARKAVLPRALGSQFRPRQSVVVFDETSRRRGTGAPRGLLDISGVRKSVVAFQRPSVVAGSRALTRGSTRGSMLLSSSRRVSVESAVLSDGDAGDSPGVARKKTRFQVGDRVRVRDGDDPWRTGKVTSADPLEVLADGLLHGLGWDEVEPLQPPLIAGHFHKGDRVRLLAAVSRHGQRHDKGQTGVIVGQVSDETVVVRFGQQQMHVHFQCLRIETRSAVAQGQEVVTKAKPPAESNAVHDVTRLHEKGQRVWVYSKAANKWLPGAFVHRKGNSVEVKFQLGSSDKKKCVAAANAGEQLRLPHWSPEVGDQVMLKKDQVRVLARSGLLHNLVMHPMGAVEEVLWSNLEQPSVQAASSEPADLAEVDHQFQELKGVAASLFDL